MGDYRMEKDFLGELKVPKAAYWGAQTQRAIENFPISGIRFGRVHLRPRPDQEGRRGDEHGARLAGREAREGDRESGR